MNRSAVIAVLALVVAGLTPSRAEEADAPERNDPLNAVVLIETSTSEANVFRPWQSYTDSSSGSGAVIGKGLILTCAHCVADASYIRVRKHNEDSLYHATVAFIDNDADLALVKVEDKEFDGDEAVVVSDILPDVCMEGYLGVDRSLVRTVNGTKVKNLRHFVQLVESCRDGFVRFGLDRDDEWDVKMIVDAKELRDATPRVMQRYQIPADRSDDLK